MTGERQDFSDIVTFLASIFFVCECRGGGGTGSLPPQTVRISHCGTRHFEYASQHTFYLAI